jgi:hypothetical protein
MVYSRPNRAWAEQPPRFRMLDDAGGGDAVGTSFLVKELLHSLGGQGRREEISSREIAAQSSETLELGGLFDALGHDFALQFAGQHDDEVDHVLAGAIRLHASHQGARDFQDVSGEVAQRGKRYGAGTEVVDCRSHFKAPELREDARRLVWVCHGDAGGDTELKGTGPHLGFA